jgi:hypothetical protein
VHSPFVPPSRKHGTYCIEFSYAVAMLRHVNYRSFDSDCAAFDFDKCTWSNFPLDRNVNLITKSWLLAVNYELFVLAVKIWRRISEKES